MAHGFWLECEVALSSPPYKRATKVLIGALTRTPWFVRRSELNHHGHRCVCVCYNNLPLQFTLWTRVIRVNLVGRCVLCRFPSNQKQWAVSEKKYQWRKQQRILCRCVGGRWWRNDANWRITTYRWQNPAYRDICWIWKCCHLQKFWSSTQLCPWHRRSIALLQCSKGSWIVERSTS